MPPSDALLKSYKRQIGQYRDRTSRLLIAAWDGLSSYDESDIETFTRKTAPALAGSKAAAVALSAGFFATALKIPPVGVNPRDVVVEPKIPSAFHATWHALKEGRPLDEAIGVGRSVTESVGFDFVQSAARLTGDVVAERSGRRVTWRRVPGGNSCAWCHEVASGTYSSAEAADFGHERCDCDAVPD